MRYSKAYKEKAVKKVLEMRDTQTMGTIAKGLNISKATLHIWLKNTKDTQTTDGVITLSDKLQILKESYSMNDEALSAYCREKGLFKHQLQEWEKDFLKVHKPEDSTAKKALEEERSKSKALAKELRRKEKALAETATLLVLQKVSSTVGGRGSMIPLAVRKDILILVTQAHTDGAPFYKIAPIVGCCTRTLKRWQANEQDKQNPANKLRTN
ncbi:MAG: hypothetical protein Q9M43_04515 [Sulfurimonas sp.]|nr:hypothetical protein [Sulfurimonas sp.]